ncbi:MAG: hypothetical protein DME30_00920 [Verrucomicrobia bacterium]|nr:MAG: hypothetical protein DME30_00920 [Verrucomicrobiota bacterium]
MRRLQNQCQETPNQVKPIFHAAILITTFSWPVANGLGQRSVTIGVWPDNFPGRGRKSQDAPGSHTGAAKNPGRRAIAAPPSTFFLRISGGVLEKVRTK